MTPSDASQLTRASREQCETAGAWTSIKTKVQVGAGLATLAGATAWSRYREPDATFWAVEAVLVAAFIPLVGAIVGTLRRRQAYLYAVRRGEIESVLLLRPESEAAPEPTEGEPSASQRARAEYERLVDRPTLTLQGLTITGVEQYYFDMRTPGARGSIGTVIVAALAGAAVFAATWGALTVLLPAFGVPTDPGGVSIPVGVATAVTALMWARMTRNTLRSNRKYRAYMKWRASQPVGD